MAIPVDTDTYNKATIRVPGQGYGWQTKTAAGESLWVPFRGTGKKTRIIVHSTNGKKGTSFAGEAKFLRESAAVSAHFLVGKEGQIAQFLPITHWAWHAGSALSGWGNDKAIGVEAHHAIGELWTIAQRNALTDLMLRLMREEGIPATSIERHRFIALPKGRKSDPDDWSDVDFEAWRYALGMVSA